MQISLSYIMTTYNKLSYLKITLPYLLDACKNDEEIVIVDGGSTDGTVEYLEDLYQQKKIHQFISEKDFGEAHGTNKAMLMAKGELLKIITDDDVFDFVAIHDCKTHMLSDKSIDVLGSEGLSINMNLKRLKIDHTTNLDTVIKWKRKENNCWFSGLSLMIRKKSMTYLGLFNTAFKMVDFEYIARLSILRPNLCFYTGYTYLNIVNSDSNSFSYSDLLIEEQKKINNFYFTHNKTPLKLFKLRTIHKISKAKKYISKNSKALSNADQITYLEIFTDSRSKLTEENRLANKKFI